MSVWSIDFKWHFQDSNLHSLFEFQDSGPWLLNSQFTVVLLLQCAFQSLLWYIDISLLSGRQTRWRCFLSSDCNCLSFLFSMRLHHLANTQDAKLHAISRSDRVTESSTLWWNNSERRNKTGISVKQTERQAYVCRLAARSGSSECGTRIGNVVSASDEMPEREGLSSSVSAESSLAYASDNSNFLEDITTCSARSDASNTEIESNHSRIEQSDINRVPDSNDEIGFLKASCQGLRLPNHIAVRLHV